MTTHAQASPIDLAFAKAALEAFMDNERDKGAIEGLACEIAGSLLMEIEEGAENCLIGLPPLKQSILDYVIEQEQRTQEDLEADSDRSESSCQ